MTMLSRAVKLERRRSKRAARRELIDLAWLALGVRAVEVVNTALSRWNDREDRIAASSRSREG